MLLPRPQMHFGANQGDFSTQEDGKGTFDVKGFVSLKDKGGRWGDGHRGELGKGKDAKTLSDSFMPCPSPSYLAGYSWLLLKLCSITLLFP